MSQLNNTVVVAPTAKVTDWVPMVTTSVRSRSTTSNVSAKPGGTDAATSTLTAVPCTAEAGAVRMARVYLDGPAPEAVTSPSVRGPS